MATAPPPPLTQATQQPQPANEDYVPSFAPLLQPQDEEAKAKLPNCTVCRGCNVELDDMSERYVR